MKCFLARLASTLVRPLSKEAKQEHVTTQDNGCTEYGKLSVEFDGSGCEQAGHGNGKNKSSLLLVNTKWQGLWCSRVVEY